MASAAGYPNSTEETTDNTSTGCPNRVLNQEEARDVLGINNNNTAGNIPEGNGPNDIAILSTPVRGEGEGEPGRVRKLVNFCMSYTVTPLARAFTPAEEPKRHVIRVNTSGENADRIVRGEGPSGNGEEEDRINRG